MEPVVVEILTPTVEEMDTEVEMFQMLETYGNGR